METTPDAVVADGDGGGLYRAADWVGTENGQK
jgi:hypothetical protein